MEAEPMKCEGCAAGPGEVERLRGVIESIGRELDRPDADRKWHGQEWCIREHVRRGLKPDAEERTQVPMRCNRCTQPVREEVEIVCEDCVQTFGLKPGAPAGGDCVVCHETACPTPVREPSDVRLEEVRGPRGDVISYRATPGQPMHPGWVGLFVLAVGAGAVLLALVFK